MCEKAKTAAVIACYADGVRDLSRLIDDELNAANLRIAQDARAALVELLGGDRLASADAAGHEHRNLLRHFGQDFLRQHAGRDRADMAARFHALDHQRVDARSHQLLRKRQRGRETDQLGAIGLDRLDAALGRQATGQHHMAHLMLGAHRDQVEQLRMHGDQVHAERLVGQRPGRRNFRVQQFGRHRATGNHAETAGVRDRRHQMPLTDPAHRPAQDRALAAEKFGAAGHQGSEFGSGHRHILQHKKAPPFQGRGWGG